MTMRILRHLIPQGFVIFGEPALFPLLIILIIIWLLPHNHIRDQALESYHQLPSVKLDLHPQKSYSNRFTTDKTAMYLETRREVQHIIPLLLHMLEVIPPDWSVLFLGSEYTTSLVSPSGPHSSKTAPYFEQGRLRMVKLEEKWAKAWGARWDDLNNEEMSSRLLTNRTFYEEELKGVEHLFTWNSGSVLCANAETDLNDWLEWDWVGAPWTAKIRGSSSGLSIRRVSKILQVLDFQSRGPYDGPEDQWLGPRLSLIPDVNIPDQDIMKGFAVESIWHDEPLGYLVVRNLFRPAIWESLENRRKIFEYCPEIKMVLEMKLSRDKCPEPTVEPVKVSTEKVGSGSSSSSGRPLTVDPSS